MSGIRIADIVEPELLPLVVRGLTEMAPQERDLLFADLRAARAALITSAIQAALASGPVQIECPPTVADLLHRGLIHPKE